MFEILVSLFFQEYLEHIQAYQFFYTELLSLRVSERDI